MTAPHAPTAGIGKRIFGRFHGSCVFWMQAMFLVGRIVPPWLMRAGEPLVLRRPELEDARAELIAPLWIQYVYRPGAEFLWFTAEGRPGDPGQVRIDGRGAGDLNALMRKGHTWTVE